VCRGLGFRVLGCRVWGLGWVTVEGVGLRVFGFVR
jgi:hypothetical protein